MLAKNYVSLATNYVSSNKILKPLGYGPCAPIP